MDLRAQLEAALGNAYTVERELGGAGMSRVFVAMETTLRRRVVVKVLPPELAAEMSAERFRREMQVAAVLQHPHIVPVLSAASAGDLLYYTMPFVEGETLRARLKREKRLPPHEAMRIMGEVADALSCAHAAGVVHRDLKPENVLLSHGHAVVADFGIAKALSDATGAAATLTTVGVVLGTPAYMSPEQAAGDPSADQRADLYSLGVMAYEMVSGAPPFSGRPAPQMLAAHIAEVPTPLSKRQPDIDPGLATLVTRLLEKRPSDRPQTASEVLAALHTTGDASAGGAGGAGVPPRAARSGPASTPGRRRVIAGTIGAVILAIVVGGVVWRERSHGVSATTAAPAAEPTERSIAVLPFVNLSDDKDNEYFSDGMTEELIDALGKIEGIRVAARTSSFAFKGKDANIREIGDKLQVASVLEGSVRRAGGRLRVSARLVDVANGYNRWSDEYERDAKDVFQVQDDISHAIVSALRVRLAGGESTPLVRPSTQDVEAYNLYLQGRYYYEKRNRESFPKAIQYFEQAIARDSTFARAWAGLADSYALNGAFGFTRPAMVRDRATMAVDRAVALDGSSPEAFTSLGLLRLFYYWDWPGAQRAFDRAIQLDPRYVPARLFHGWYYVAIGKLDSAEAEMRHGVEMDPLSLIMHTRLATVLQRAGRWKDARVELEKALALDSTYGLAWSQMTRNNIAFGRCDDALNTLGRLTDQLGAEELRVVGYTLAVCGKRNEARALAAKQAEDWNVGKALPEQVATIYAGLGDRTRAAEWLERAYDERRWSMIQMRVDPLYDSLHGDPGFEAIVAKMHFP